MASFTFIGEGTGTDAFGLKFPAGAVVEVMSEHAANKLRHNRFFAEVFDGVEVVEPVPEFVPKKRGRPPKAK